LDDRGHAPASLAVSIRCGAAALQLLHGQDTRYREAFEAVLAVCRERNVAVQVIKSIARGRGPDGAPSHTWYQRSRRRPTSDRGRALALGTLPSAS